MQEDQTLKNDVPQGTSPPTTEPQQPDIPHFLKSKKAKVISLTLLVIFFLLLTSILALSKVNQKKLSTPSLPSTPTPQLTSNQVKIVKYYQYQPKDSYILKTVSINGDTLHLKTSYTGGCNKHIFELIWSGGYAKSIPPGVDLYLVHNANHDPCEAEITDNLQFDLSPIKQDYQEKQWVGNEIIINIFDFSKIRHKLSYKLTNPTTKDWKTYTNKTLSFSFSYPSDWKLQNNNTLVSSDNLRIITISTIDFTITGISYCAAYEDKPRCETIKTKNLLISIDWGDQESNIANTTISTSDNFGIILNLQPNPNNPNFASVAPLTSDEKSLFRQILSTFIFLTPDETNKETQCIEYGGKWFDEYNECQGIAKRQCLELGGLHNDCASPCRHHPKTEMCPDVCVSICTLKNITP